MDIIHSDRDSQRAVDRTGRHGTDLDARYKGKKHIETNNTQGIKCTPDVGMRSQNRENKRGSASRRRRKGKLK